MFMSQTQGSYSEGYEAGYSAGWKYVALSCNPHVKGQTYFDGYRDGYHQGRSNYEAYLLGKFKPQDATIGF